MAGKMSQGGGPSGTDSPFNDESHIYLRTRVWETHTQTPHGHSHLWLSNLVDTAGGQKVPSAVGLSSPIVLA